MTNIVLGAVLYFLCSYALLYYLSSAKGWKKYDGNSSFHALIFFFWWVLIPIGLFAMSLQWVAELGKKNRS